MQSPPGWGPPGVPPGAPGGGYAYGAPPAAPGYAPQATPGQTAGVWPWYVAYAMFMGLMYLGCIAGGAWIVSAGSSTFGTGPQADEVVMQGYILLAMGVPLSVLYLAVPFLPKRPWAWIYHVVLIGFGLTSCACWPVAIPLIIYWLKPETKWMFGRDLPGYGHPSAGVF